MAELRMRSSQCMKQKRVNLGKCHRGRSMANFRLRQEYIRLGYVRWKIRDARHHRGRKNKKKDDGMRFASLQEQWRLLEKKESISFRIASYGTGSALILGRGLSLLNNSGLAEDDFEVKIISE